MRCAHLCAAAFVLMMVDDVACQLRGSSLHCPACLCLRLPPTLLLRSRPGHPAADGLEVEAPAASEEAAEEEPFPVEEQMVAVAGAQAELRLLLVLNQCPCPFDSKAATPRCLHHCCILVGDCALTARMCGPPCDLPAAEEEPAAEAEPEPVAEEAPAAPEEQQLEVAEAALEAAEAADELMAEEEQPAAAEEAAQLAATEPEPAPAAEEPEAAAEPEVEAAAAEEVVEEEAAEEEPTPAGVRLGDRCCMRVGSVLHACGGYVCWRLHVATSAAAGLVG